VDNYSTTVALDATGKAKVSQSFSTPGSHTVTATYNGSTNYAGSGSVTLNQSILPATTTTDTSTATSPTLGQTVTLTAAVAPAAGGGTPTGTVTFVIDGVNQTPVAVNGSDLASLGVKFASAGPHTVSAIYNGDSNFAPSTAPTLNVSVNKATSTSGLYDLGAAPTVYGQQAQILVNVASSVAGGPVPTGAVQFLESYNGSSYGLFTAANGQNLFILNGNGQLLLPISNTAPAGTYNFVVSYGGDSNYNASSSQILSHTIKQSQTTSTVSLFSATTTTTGELATFYAAALPVAPGAGTPTGTITFSVILNGNTVVATTVAVNSVGMAGLYNVNLAAGNYTVEVNYSGDLDFITSSFTTTINITGSSGVGRQT
jgi:hypothetical protein